MSAKMHPDPIPRAVSERLTEIEMQLSALKAEDDKDAQFVKEAHELIEKGQKHIKAAGERVLIRGVELTKLEIERDALCMAVRAFQETQGLTPLLPKEVIQGEPTAPRATGAVPQPVPGAGKRILRLLANANKPLTRIQISEALEIPIHSTSSRLHQLRTQKLVSRTDEGWVVR